MVMFSKSMSVLRELSLMVSGSSLRIDKLQHLRKQMLSVPRKLLDTEVMRAAVSGFKFSKGTRLMCCFVVFALCVTSKTTTLFLEPV
jgi:hypothetical protein